jgi:FolB domain-containing protein
MTDNIHIHDFGLWIRIGINEEEQKEHQVVFVDLTLFCDLRLAGKTDNLADTIDYREVCRTVRSISDRTFSTVEGLAETIASAIKHAYPVSSVTVRIKKPGALVRSAKYAAVEITR